jgi:hypothetical protein
VRYKKTQTQGFAVRPEKRTANYFSVHFSLSCALYKTQGKEALCRVPEIKCTAKIFTHGKNELSRSGLTCTTQ